MEYAKVYCPASLSLIFKICPDKNLVKMGSVGVGFTINQGVTCLVKKAPVNRIFFNGKLVNIPPVSLVVERLSTSCVNIDIHSLLPLGCGFGISSASTLSTVVCLNQLLNIKKTNVQLYKIAHIAEIECHTGLGSVGTQITGGFIFKTHPGLPVVAKFYPFVGKKIYAIILGKIETPKILKNKGKSYRINQAAEKALREIIRIKKPSLTTFLNIAYNFAKISQILPNQQITSLIENLRQKNIPATQAMLGQVIITNRDPCLDSEKYTVIKLVISQDKVGLI